ncbi:uncharacterized protein SCHCODRAFT_02672519 [Schizophyllum commune H4-8]|uniref:Uncharacterized protein n=1 Tax=Schizophyllum commune (strain H4-8 / FGSC 9210) TaxID=578458 RepID=D8QJL5_SCHCM|nr:uncharacterized protein SCHCODRAFT_02672519 [Schizophyllum commune H4-8]KAI5886271.1 hypothetical protein SCHCODRAFT_02672519 [Schizophyllum commune H4-8]
MRILSNATIWTLKYRIRTPEGLRAGGGLGASALAPLSPPWLEQWDRIQVSRRRRPTSTAKRTSGARSKRAASRAAQGLLNGDTAGLGCGTPRSDPEIYDAGLEDWAATGRGVGPFAKYKGPDPSLWKSLLFRAHHQSTPNALVAFVASQSWDCSSSSSPRLSGTNGLDSRHRATLIRLALGHQVDRPDTQFPLSSYHRLPRCRAQPAHLGRLVAVSGFNVGYLSPPQTTGKEGHTEVFLGRNTAQRPQPLPLLPDATSESPFSGTFRQHATARGVPEPYCGCRRDPVLHDSYRGTDDLPSRPSNRRRQDRTPSGERCDLSTVEGVRALSWMRCAMGEGSPSSVGGKELAGGGGNMGRAAGGMRALPRVIGAMGEAPPLPFPRKSDALNRGRGRAVPNRRRHAGVAGRRMRRGRGSLTSSPLSKPHRPLFSGDFGRVFDGLKPSKAREGLLSEGRDEGRRLFDEAEPLEACEGGTQIEPPEASAGPIGLFQRLFDEAEPPEAREGRPLDGIKPPEACLGTRGVRKMTRRSRVAGEARAPFALVMRRGENDEREGEGGDEGEGARREGG